MSGSAGIASVTDQKRRSFWLKHLHQWHWISAGLSLIGMILFAITGITLNHAADIAAKPVVTTKTGVLPASLLDTLDTADDGEAPLPAHIQDWVSQELRLSVKDKLAEWSDDEIYLSLPRPGGDAWLSIDRESGDVHYEKTDRGWISYFNDLHKGRSTGLAWKWFIDIFAVACVVFCVTGLFLLQLHAKNRPATWPVVGLGLVIPLVLAILFIH